MIRQVALLIVAMTFGVAGFAQNFFWGYPFGLDDETEMDVQHIIDRDVYRLMSKYDLSIYNYRISSTAFNQQDLEKIGTQDLGIEQPLMGSASMTHHSMYEKNGVDFIFFSRESDRETNANQLFWQDVNIKTGQKSDFKELTKIEGKNFSNNGQFLTAQSPDGNFYAVLKEPAFYKKTPEKIEIELYDRDLNQVATIKHEFEWNANRSPKHILHVGNDGNVYVLKTVDLKKMKPYTLAYVWEKNADNLKEFSLKQDDNYQIAQVYSYFIGNDFYCAALLSHEGATTFGMSIDMDGRHSGTRSSALLVVKFSDGKLNYQTRNDFDIFSNLSIKSILAEGEHHYVVMERMQVDKNSSNTNLTASNVDYEYSYLSNGFFISMLNPQTGEMMWTYQIDTAEPNTRNDNGAYLSVLPLVRNGNLVLFYNETRELKNDYGSRRFPIKEVVNSSGETIAREALLSAGVGVEKDEYFDLDTGVIVPVSENKYLIRARSGDQFKYGYMTF